VHCIVDDDDLLTLPQIADMLGLNPSTVRLWVSEQRLPAQMSGNHRRWLVHRSDLEELLASQPRVGKPRSGAPQASAPQHLGELALADHIEPLRGRG
jgi:excisionase family DNA binding protein